MPQDVSHCNWRKGRTHIGNRKTWKIFHNLKIFQENVPARIYEQPLLLQPNPSTLILEAHIHANPKPKVDLKKYFLRKFLKFSQISWLCNGDFVKESDRKQSTLTSMEGERNKWAARMTITVSWSSLLV